MDIKIFKLNKKLNDIKRLEKVKDYTIYTFYAQITLPFLLALHCQLKFMYLLRGTTCTNTSLITG